ncbi:MAG: hypothetical protein MRY63_12945 [Neomegalonema sp.]|nr:hypothetical protein [Neomegalonema sp.]
MFAAVSSSPYHHPVRAQYRVPEVARADSAENGAPDNGGTRADTATSMALRAVVSGLTQAELREVAELKARDRQVRAHEQAHATVGGQYASAPRYEYQVGPDAQRYAIAGHVMIDTAPVADDPEATVAKMEVVKAAALAPVDPSSADRQVAATADALRNQALAELFTRRRAEEKLRVEAMHEAEREAEAEQAQQPSQAAAHKDASPKMASSLSSPLAFLQFSYRSVMSRELERPEGYLVAHGFAREFRVRLSIAA